MYKITLNDVGFSYNSQKVLVNIGFVAEPGDFICLLGPSGCGKSTLLRLLAGLEKTGTGEIFINEKPILGPGLDRGVVFQDYSLFPWMTARENIVIALEQAFPEKSRRELSGIAAEYLDLVGLQEAYDKLPKELSGGMRQRAAIALVFAINSPVLLMDEPLDEFARLFHDRHVRGKVRVKDPFKTHAPQCRVHLFRDVRPDRETKSLAEGNADRRGDLDHAILFGVAKGFPCESGIVFFDDSARRAVCGALAAAHAR